MNSSFIVSDVGAFSPLDYSHVSFLRTPLSGAVRSSRGAEQWKVFVEPNVSIKVTHQAIFPNIFQSHVVVCRVCPNLVLAFLVLAILATHSLCYKTETVL